MRLFQATLLSACVAVAASCTFGGIADYEVEPCVPATTQSEDVCDRLDPDATCDPFQCDAATKHCVRRPRDDDRDGDPSTTCGGGDCDDANPINRSGSAEICDGKDNTCDGLIDEAVASATFSDEVKKLDTLASTADVTFSSNNGEDSVASVLVKTAGGTCIQAAILKVPSPGFLFDGCSFLSSEPTLAPRQPYVQLAQSGGATLFVLTSGCGKGALAYRYSSGIAGKAELACSDTVNGVALPALAPFSDDPNSAAALYFDVPFSSRDTLDDCSTAAPASLHAVLVDGATSSNPAFAKGDERVLTSDSTAIRPPGIVPVPGTNVVLVAAPSGADVSVWPLSRDALKVGGSAPAGVAIPELANARSASVAMAPDGTVAVVAEIGCPGDQRVRLALGDFDAASKSVSFSKTVDVAPQQALATGPGVAWGKDRAEWLISWVTSGAVLRARRFTIDGTPMGDAFDVTSPAGGAMPASDGKIYVLDATSGNSRFSAFAVGCQ